MISVGGQISHQNDLQLHIAGYITSRLE